MQKICGRGMQKICGSEGWSKAVLTGGGDATTQEGGGAGEEKDVWVRGLKEGCYDKGG